jgi:CheY-like chemotaxis protein
MMRTAVLRLCGQPAARPSRSAPISTLLVDDEHDNLWTMKEVLDRPGLDVLTATSAPGALALLDEHEMSLAVLDIPIPAIAALNSPSGCEATKEAGCRSSS